MQVMQNPLNNTSQMEEKTFKNGYNNISGTENILDPTGIEEMGSTRDKNTNYISYCNNQKKVNYTWKIKDDHDIWSEEPK